MRTIGIIGGKGRFGQWFKNFFQGHPLFPEQEILVSDVETEISCTELTRRSDVILVSVPISIVPKLLAEITPLLTEEKLLVEITSVKSHLTTHLSRMPCDALSLHPMFAPSLTVTGQRVTHYRFQNSPTDRGALLHDRILHVLEEAGALLVPITPEAHDRAMAVVQGLTHLSAIALGSALERLDADVSALQALSSPVYQIRMAMVGRVLGQDPRLYGEIATVNPYVKESIEAFSSALNELSGCIESGDISRFSEIFRSAGEHLGDFLQEAQEESDLLIQKIVEQKGG